MPRVMKKVEYPARVENRVEFYVCACGKRTRCLRDWKFVSFFHREEVNISIEVGDVYPEGGSTTKTEWDICPDCFQRVVVAALEMAGFSPVETEYDI